MHPITNVLYFPDYHHDRMETKKRPISPYTGSIFKLKKYNYKVYIPKTKDSSNMNIHQLVSVITTFPHLSNYDIVLTWLIPALFLGFLVKIFGKKKTKLGLIAITPVSKPFTIFKRLKYYIVLGLLQNYDFAICHSNIQQNQFSSGFGINPDRVYEWILGIDISFFGKNKPNYKNKSINLIFHGDESRDLYTLYKLASSKKLEIRRTSRHKKDIMTHYELTKIFQGTNNLVKLDIGVEFCKIRDWMRNSRISLILLERGTDQPAGIFSLLESMASMCAIIITRGAASSGYIIHQHNGYVVPPRVNANDLFLIIDSLLSSEMGEKLALNAYKQALKYHNFDQSARNLARILDNIKAMC